MPIRRHLTIVGSAARRRPWLLPAVLVYSLCRLPSFFEPHWYTDEAGYTITARTLLHGAPLYSQAWTNKPPLHIWAVALPLRLFGPSESGLHALTFLSGLLALIGVGVLASHLLSNRRTIVATVLFAIAIGLPTFQAQLALPESLLIAPATWAAVIVFTRLLSDQPNDRLPRWIFALSAGALMGVALGFQQTALADAAVFGAAITIAPSRDRRAIAAYVLALLAVVAAWLVPALLVAGSDTIAFALVGFYTGYVQYSLPVSPLGIALRALGPLLAIIGFFIARRAGARTVALCLWACADLGVSAIANRPYPHFLVPALAPCILLLLSIPIPRVRLNWRLAPLTAAFVITLPFALLATADGNALLAYATWPLAQLQGNRIDWDHSLDQRGPADQQVAGWIRDQGLAGTSAVVWSSSAWPYLLADLPVSLRAAPIYNDVVLLGSGHAVANTVDAMQPQLIVTSEEALEQWPEIGTVLDGNYQLVYESYPDKVYLRKQGGG